jgi:Pin2-interacting protein X1
MAAETARMQRYQGVQKESAAYRLMTSMGWKEGEGLGAAKQGIKEHIRVRRNFENWGVGAVTAAERARDWSTGMLDFHRVLSSLSEITSQHACRTEIPSDEDSDASGGEQDNVKSLIARKPKAFGTQSNEEDAKKRNKSSKEKKGGAKEKGKSLKKRKRTGEKSGDDEDGSGSDAQQGANTGTVQDDATAAVPRSGKRVKFATHVGRFKKRETAKMVKNYSQHDLAAILGTDPFAEAAKTVNAAEVELKRSPSPQSVSKDCQSSPSSEEDDAPAAKKTGVIGTGARPAGKKEHSVRIPQPAEGAGDEQLEKPSQEERQWWSDYFAYAGRAGSGRDKAKAVRNRGFSEQDQTDLYAAAQGGATQGRVGLGRSSMPKKVAGARWQGKKIKLGSDSDSDEQEEEQDALPSLPRVSDSNRVKNDDEVFGKKGVLIVLPRGRSLNANASGGDNDGNEAPAQGMEEEEEEDLDVDGIKWKRVAVDILGALGGEMKMKVLIKKALAAKGLGKARKDAVRVAVMAAVQSSSKFAIEGKVVRLVSSKS